MDIMFVLIITYNSNKNICELNVQSINVLPDMKYLPISLIIIVAIIFNRLNN